MTPIRVSAIQTKEIGRWILWADIDYLAARLLYMIDLLIQATTLANTAIEKYLKAICCIFGMKIPRGRGHDVLFIYKAIKAHVPGTTLCLLEDYLELLGKIYQLRYPDQLQNGFTIALNRAKMLAQLDRSVLEITSRFQGAPGYQGFPMVLTEAEKRKDKRYLDTNVAVDPSSISKLFWRPSWCYELRKYSDDLRESIYRVPCVADDLVFPQPVITLSLTEETNWACVFGPILYA